MKRAVIFSGLFAYGIALLWIGGINFDERSFDTAWGISAVTIFSAIATALFSDKE